MKMCRGELESDRAAAVGRGDRENREMGARGRGRRVTRPKQAGECLPFSELDAIGGGVRRAQTRDTRIARESLRHSFRVYHSTFRTCRAGERSKAGRRTGRIIP